MPTTLLLAHPDLKTQRQLCNLRSPDCYLVHNYLIATVSKADYDGAYMVFVTYALKKFGSIVYELKGKSPSAGGPSE